MTKIGPELNSFYVETLARSNREWIRCREQIGGFVHSGRGTEFYSETEATKFFNRVCELVRKEFGILGVRLVRLHYSGEVVPVVLKSTGSKR